tara:strand:- start:3651 stop:4436 length:786 start_codon:yes stop_codon:yes gene_type:complete
MSIRYISKQQFSDGTTIDGNRLEDALQKLEQLSDNVPLSAIKTRFTQSQIVFGFSPILDVGNARRDPYFPIVNTGPVEINNTYRYKGTSANTSTGLLGWESSTTFDHPVIIHNLTYAMLQDDAAGSPYQLPGHSSGTYVPPTAGQVEVHIYVDSEYTPSDRTQSDMEIHKQNFTTDAWLLTSSGLSGTPTTVMSPDYPGGNATGWFISLKDLNIPVRAFGRIRMVLLIPDETGSTALWGSQPWRTFTPTMTATFLEPLRYG